MEAGEGGEAVRYCQSWPHRFSNSDVYRTYRYYYVTYNTYLIVTTLS